MIVPVLRRLSLTPAVASRLVVVSTRAMVGPALATSVSQQSYSTHKANFYPFSKDHTFDENDMAKKHFDAIKNKQATTTTTTEKINTQAFVETNHFDQNETIIKASRLAETVEKRNPKKQPEAAPKKKVSSDKKLTKEELTAKNAFDENEAATKASRLEEQAKPFEPEGEPFVKEAFMAENSFDENETFSKAARLAEQAEKTKATRAT